MDSRDDISATRSLLWSNERATLDEVEEKYGFPQIVKMTSETSKIYELPDEEPILIYGRRNLTRTIAHTIEEGDYVMGKQLDISNEFSGSFKLSTDFGRNEVPLKTFSSIQEVAAFFPSKIYVQELLTIKNEDASGKPSTTVLLKGDELTVLNRITMPLPSAKLPIRFGRSKQFSTQIVPGLSCHSTRLNTNISLPLTCKGSFATRTPIEVNAFERTREMPLEQLIESVNFPITVKVATNRSRSPKDDFLLRSGMHLKLIGVEDHNIMVGVAPFNRIIELSPSSWDYYLPSALTQPQENELDLNQYKTYLQNAYMASKIQGSATNVDDYCKSVRFHINRSKRPTKPKPWNKNVNLRSPSQRSSRKVRPAISAIQLLSNQPENHTRTTQGRKQAHRALPMPNTSPSAAGPDCPPLPPRNKATDYSQPPRIPPKTRSSNIFTEPLPLDMPTRAAPVPNLHGNNYTTMQFKASNTCTERT
uniref:CABIT domain-containing protein n=1 Tax=Ciona savignyi TaxID=51511 RepID=H2Z9Y9_CIOSA